MRRQLLGRPQTHPEKAELEVFMRGEMPRAEARDVVRHLLAGCPVCVQVTRELWKLGDLSTATLLSTTSPV